MVLSVPACLLAAYARRTRCSSSPASRRALGRDGVSRRRWPSSPRCGRARPRTKSIALWSALGGGIAALGPLIAGVLLEQFWWGSVFLVTLPLVGVALVMALALRAGHVNETTEPVDNLGGILSVVLVGALDPRRSTSRRSRTRERWPRAAVDRGRRGDRVRHPPTACGEPALRPRGRRPADLLGRRLRRHHRLRLVDGRGVRQPAVPAERARLLDVEAGAAILPAVVFMVLVAPRSAKLVEARGARFTLLVGYVFLLPRRSSDAAASGRRAAPTGRSGSPTPSSASASGWPDARLAFADRVGAGRACGHGVRHRRPAARPRRRAAHVGLRRAARRGLCIGDGSRDHLVTTRAERHRQHAEPTAALLLERSRPRAQNPKYSSEILAAAKESFLQGDQWAYTAGVDRHPARCSARVSQVPAPRRREGAPEPLPPGGRGADDGVARAASFSGTISPSRESAAGCRSSCLLV